MSRPILWLAGPAGSGKTTAGRKAAHALGLEYRSAGERFRAEAARRGMTLAAFSEYAEAHDEVDRSLDAGLAEEARPGSVVEGRVVGALLRRAGRAVFAVRVDATEEVRAERLAGRDGTDLPTALARLRTRAASERKRYAHLYGIALEAEAFDAVLDTTALGPAEAAERLTAIFRAAGAAP